MSASLAGLVNAAGAAAAAGRWQEAERLWAQVRAQDPGHVQALFSLGVHAFQRGDSAGALELLEQARTRAPGDPMIPLSIARVHRETHHPDREWAAIIAALDIDPYFLPGLLARGEFLERQKRSRAAAAVFRDVLKVAPPPEQWPRALQARLQHAQDAVARDTEEIAAFLQHQTGSQRSAVDAALGSRWDEAVSILAGKSKPYHSNCNQLHVPRLPALTFYDDALFPWMRELEAQTDAIKAELQDMIVRREAEFVPYIQYPPGTPVNQWDKLNHSRNWSGFHLYAHGEPVQEHLARCPRTAEALALVDTVELAGLCPNAMFSALAPGAHIPPHTGETNARLVAHLPLVVPDGCHYRVGHDWRQWQEGKCWVFDDTIEHEARNDGTALRVILMFDVWNPLLSLAEREMVKALSNAMRDWRTTSDGA
ncbi:aspartyl/asparaginyl beta-hydroxylase domain-containing protein [Flavobacterium sp. MXW15]|uniref:Aspartyl/asparaginyl beta-hydroxylase domain-containing protein n=1 Tax=Xanthomonas chitinilytica TaxID=2989819 RepID=A0ABT3JWN5_9XANT|nr:aspartyl/asparaginyl beta-hydroxylase domain-containing protein [Xanthomonas sp. H13-6]MCW4455624.1 aspartyl/asparaginyl beta-hydroxylase domain-containing protein [Flavobacterium sp. MXW15]MCW4472890.1 aspartyl/asparaginyl beta-hydroxylase domain-containing protein [Xanthomonas sp. H13-6]